MNKIRLVILALALLMLPVLAFAGEVECEHVVYTLTSFNNGYHKFKCDNCTYTNEHMACEESYIRNIDATNHGYYCECEHLLRTELHDMSAWSLDGDVERRDCTKNCDYFETREPGSGEGGSDPAPDPDPEPEPDPTPRPHSHRYTGTVTEPTCESGGYTTYYCTCGDSFVGSRVDALGHALGAWESDGQGGHSRVCSRDASHTAQGSCADGADADELCDACGYDLHVHSYDSYAYDQHTHWQVCRCGATLTAERHDWYIYKKTASKHYWRCDCGNDGWADAHFDDNNTGKCDDCGYAMPHSHDWGEWAHDPKAKNAEDETHTHTRVCKGDSAHTETQECTFTYVDGIDSTGVTNWYCTVCSYRLEIGNSEYPLLNMEHMYRSAGYFFLQTFKSDDISHYFMPSDVMSVDTVTNFYNNFSAAIMLVQTLEPMFGPYNFDTTDQDTSIMSTEHATAVFEAATGTTIVPVEEETTPATEPEETTEDAEWAEPSQFEDVFINPKATKEATEATKWITTVTEPEETTEDAEWAEPSQFEDVFINPKATMETTEATKWITPATEPEETTEDTEWAEPSQFEDVFINPKATKETTEATKWITTVTEPEETTEDADWSVQSLSEDVFVNLSSLPTTSISIVTISRKATATDTTTTTKLGKATWNSVLGTAPRAITTPTHPKAAGTTTISPDQVTAPSPSATEPEKTTEPTETPDQVTEPEETTEDAETPADASATSTTYDVSVVSAWDVSISGYDQALVDTLSLHTDQHTTKQASALLGDMSTKQTAWKEFNPSDPGWADAAIAYSQAKESFYGFVDSAAAEAEIDLTGTLYVPLAKAQLKAGATYVAVHDTNPYAEALQEAEKSRSVAPASYQQIEAAYDDWNRQHGADSGAYNSYYSKTYTSLGEGWDKAELENTYLMSVADDHITYPPAYLESEDHVFLGLDVMHFSPFIIYELTEATTP